MKKISSFCVDHNKLLKGLYVSRKDLLANNETLTSFDIRMKEPNREPVMSTKAMHSLEHLGATWLRNHGEWENKIIYFGPMGCRTGFYLILRGDLNSEDILPLIQNLFKDISNWSEEIPGVSAIECGNYKDHDLEEAKKEAKLYYEKVLLVAGKENLNYPS